MHTSFFTNSSAIFIVESTSSLSPVEKQVVEWMLQATSSESSSFPGEYLGPRREMVTPWSTNAVEIAGNLGVDSINRIERFEQVLDGKLLSGGDFEFDPMTQGTFSSLNEKSLVVDGEPEPLTLVDDIAAYNTEHGLALSEEEVKFLEKFASDSGRKITDAELFGFAQINSEHCRHKIFNGTFVLDGEEKPSSLFDLIKKTTAENGASVVSAYKDNVAFMKGPVVNLFLPGEDNRFGLSKKSTVISLKAETHNFPTTVEPFSGASTGSGGEIRDRMAGGRGSIPLAGTSVYMTSYPRLEGSLASSWESKFSERGWKYQSPREILTKASNGASDFGNKFGQPLISGSLLVFEGESERSSYAYDRTVMLAGGIGYTTAENAIKTNPSPGQLIVVLGGDNYRIGMAGGSVSSVDTGAASTALELSAVQRPNPEMQKRVFNAIRALIEGGSNPIVLVHDHGAGGHMNCLAELVEECGGQIEVDKLPVGDRTLSVKEILSNESQERMGLVIAKEDLAKLEKVCSRERAPFYVVGEITDDKILKFIDKKDKPGSQDPVNLPFEVILGSTPSTKLKGKTEALGAGGIELGISSNEEFLSVIHRLLSIEHVACKDWLTNKVDRSVTGLVACQQCAGPLQLPLNDLGVMSLSYEGGAGVATSIGHAPIAALIDERAGSRLAIAEALTNIVFAELEDGLASVSLSANWMWPAKRPGENTRLYNAVEAVSDFSIGLGIPVPTGKDSLSMTMNYPDGSEVRAPGTVVISASAPVKDIEKTVTADLKNRADTSIVYVNFSGRTDEALGGSSLFQTLGLIGDAVPDVESAEVLKTAFEAVQGLISKGRVLAGHDVSSGGLAACLLEMAFVGDLGFDVQIPADRELSFLFSEKPAVVLQVRNDDLAQIRKELSTLEVLELGKVGGEVVTLEIGDLKLTEYVAGLRESWFKPSSLMDSFQCENDKDLERRASFARNRLSYKFPVDFQKALEQIPSVDSSRSGAPMAAILRDKGTNGDREMAFALYAAGFQVKDITMNDLMTGAEDLKDVSFLIFPGGFTNSDVLGAARGWAGSFKYNERAMSALEAFLGRENTLSLGVCNGCQLMNLLGIVSKEGIFLDHNDSGKFESNFISLIIEDSPSILLKPLVGSRLGAWVAHAEGKFVFSSQSPADSIALSYAYSEYPGNPNGSPLNAAGVVSADGRHLAMMPHIERSVRPWQWPYRDSGFEQALFTPWIMAFRTAYDWTKSKQ